MKKSAQVVEVDDEGFLALMNEVVTLFCVNFFYTGKLIGVNDTCVLLTNASIVYETGSYDDKEWGISEKLPNDIYVMTNSIEAFGIVK